MKMKKPKIPLSPDELESHLIEQISFLESSAESFDAGAEEEAKRLAVTIRILVHNTKNSHALLNQIGKKLDFYDTSLDFDPNNMLDHGGLISTLSEPHQARYVANLDNIPPNIAKMIEFESWWEKNVFVDGQGHKLSRKDLITIAANQDGGAHVDPSLDKTYVNISRNCLNLGNVVNNGTEQKIINKPERAAIRQIAHEVLKTLKPGYEKKLEYQTGVLFYGGKLTVVEEEQNDNGTPKRERKIGRNEPCPCGSGVKFKKCCGGQSKNINPTQHKIL
jgi:hypothetical protein